jgi:hypothetical protein
VLRHDLTLTLVPAWLLAALVWGSGGQSSVVSRQSSVVSQQSSVVGPGGTGD